MTRAGNDFFVGVIIRARASHKAGSQLKISPHLLIPDALHLIQAVGGVEGSQFPRVELVEQLQQAVLHMLRLSVPGGVVVCSALTARHPPLVLTQQLGQAVPAAAVGHLHLDVQSGGRNSR